MISDVRKDYVDAVIKVKVPEWQIGEEVGVYFKDTMYLKSVCERATNERHKRCIRCGRTLKDPIAQERGYGETCWKKHLADNQTTLF